MKFIILFGWTLMYVKSFMIINTNKKHSNKAILFSRLFEREHIPQSGINLNKAKEKAQLNSTQIIIDTSIISEETDDTNEAEEYEIVEINKKVRTGRSEDEDGKTNVWSVEPKMEIVEEKSSSLKILGFIIGTLSLSFQFYLMMTPFLSDLSEY